MLGTSAEHGNLWQRKNDGIKGSAPLRTGRSPIPRGPNNMPRAPKSTKTCGLCRDRSHQKQHCPKMQHFGSLLQVDQREGLALRLPMLDAFPTHQQDKSDEPFGEALPIGSDFKAIVIHHRVTKVEGSNAPENFGFVILCLNSTFDIYMNIERKTFSVAPVVSLLLSQKHKHVIYQLTQPTTKSTSAPWDNAQQDRKTSPGGLSKTPHPDTSGTKPYPNASGDHSCPNTSGTNPYPNTSRKRPPNNKLQDVSSGSGSDESMGPPATTPKSFFVDTYDETKALDLQFGKNHSCTSAQEVKVELLLSLDDNGQLLEGKPDTNAATESPEAATPKKEIFVTNHNTIHGPMGYVKSGSSPKQPRMRGQPWEHSQLVLKHGLATDLVPFARVPVNEMVHPSEMGFEPCVVPKLPYSVKKNYRECGYTNTCSLDALLALLFIATRSAKGMHRHGQELKSIPKKSLLARALDLMDQDKPDEARRLLYEALPDAKWGDWTSSQAPVSHNAYSNVGERAARLLCKDGTEHVVESVMQCDQCSHFATEDQNKKQCNMTAFTHLDETSMVEDLFQQSLKKTCPQCNNAKACKRLEMKQAPKELLVVDLTKSAKVTNKRKGETPQEQLFTMVPQRIVWRNTVFSLTGVIMGNGVRFVSVNRLLDSHVFL